MGQVQLKVKLISHTPMPSALVANAARLCYSSSNIDELENQLTLQKQEDFVQKLVDLGHYSPIEHISFTFGIEGVSRALLAQITRHRLVSFSVQSQRYVNQESSDGFNYIIPPSIISLGQDAVNEYMMQMDTMNTWYKQWVEKLGGKSEKANQDARFVLPNACETKMIMTMNARELLHFFSLRCCNRAQWEIRELSYEMLKLVYDVCPQIFKNAGASCVNGSCSEGKMSCKQQKEVKEFTYNLLKREL